MIMCSDHIDDEEETNISSSLNVFGMFGLFN